MLGSFSSFIARYLPGKIQKLTVNAGFICPNRDNSKGSGGCIYCNNATFSPSLKLSADRIEQQIENGKQFFARKYSEMRYVVYFQSYTSTNAPTDALVDIYRRAMDTEGIDGIVIGTRPDCMPDQLLDHLAEIAKTKFVMVEYGAETSHDSTLHTINRCHSWADTVDAVMRTATRGIPVGLHLIMGLPGENREMMIRTIERINPLPVDIIKCHHLQVIKNTRLDEGIKRGEYQVEEYTPDSYADLCVELLEHMRPDIICERFLSQAPPDMVVTPRWGLKNYQFMNLLCNKIKALGKENLLSQ